MSPRIGILHMTESSPGTATGVASYLRRIGAEVHFLLDPSTGYREQMLPLGQVAKALRNLPGGVETNRREGVPVQVEIVGRSAEVGGYDDAWYATLREQLEYISAEAGVSYAFHMDPARLSPEEWDSPALPAMWYGHCNVPENDHWDPGTLDYARLSLPTPEVSTDMQLSDPLKLRQHDPETAAFTEEIPGTVAGALTFGHAEAQQANYRVELLRQEVASLKNVVQALVTVTQAAPAASRPPVVDYELLANLVVDKLALRLAGRA